MNRISYFERNRQQRIEIPWERKSPTRESLIRSLQRFHVAGRGDGDHLELKGDAEYAHAVSRFMEEGIHSAFLQIKRRHLIGWLVERHRMLIV